MPAPTAHVNDYTLGRARVYFDRFGNDGSSLTGRRYFGNTPGFSLTIASEELDHYSSDEGTRTLDESTILETTQEGTLSCDSIDAENLALFFFGERSTITQTIIGAPTTERFTVMPKRMYQVGQTVARPAGLRKVTISSVVIDPDSAATSTTENTDWKQDVDRGVFEIVETAKFVADTPVEIEVTYTAAASTYEQVISGQTPVQGAIWVEANNPVGPLRDFYLPKVQLSPNGEFALKGDDWLTMEFALKILKRDSSTAAVYINGQPT